MFRARRTALRSMAAVLFALPAFFAVLGFASAAGESTICAVGGGAAQCTNPKGLTLDSETGRLYVADKGRNAVDVFTEAGSPLAPIGEGQLKNPEWVAVDNAAASPSRHDVWATTDPGTGAEALVKKFLPDGTFVAAESFGKEGSGPCEFSANSPISAGPEGKVYVADSVAKGGSLFADSVIVFSSAGACLEQVPLFEGNRITGLAVDPTGDIYITDSGSEVREYSPAGVLLRELEAGNTPEGIGIDAAGNLFVKEQAQQKTKPALIQLFAEFPPTGTEPLRRFGYSPGGFFGAPGLAASSPACDLYASETAERGVRCLKLPDPGPVAVPEACHVKLGALGNTRATLQAELNPEGEETTYRFEYSAAGGSAQSTPTATLPADFELHEAAIQVTGLEPETVYHCRAIAENASSASPTLGEEGEFKTRPGFEFGPAWASGVQEATAVLNVEGDPLGVPATGQVEYVTDALYRATGFAEAQLAPTPELDFGSGEAMQLRSVALTGLVPGTLYHYRLRARNGTPPEGVVCPEQKSSCPELEHAFRTYLPEALGDNRGFELVSPGEKNSAEVATPSQPSGLFEPRSVRIQAAAGSGEAVTYTSWTSFGTAEGSAATSQYLSKRTAGGWQTENITPSGSLANPLVPPVNGFTPDLGFEIFKITEPPLTPDCQAANGGSIPEDIYLRDLDTGALRCLDPEGAEGPEGIPCLLYAGMSEGGGRVFVAGTPKGGTFFTYSLYEWTPEGMHPVSILPSGEPAPATQGTAFGRSVSQSGVEACSVGLASLRNVISSDGSRVFWTLEPERGSGEASRLFVRLDGTKTLQLDAKPTKKAGAGPFGNGVFQVASADGSTAYFTDDGRLVSGSKAVSREPGPAKPDLYRYEPGNEAEPLADLTKGAVAGDVQGVIGASDDGSYVYFVARGALTGEEEDSAGEKAVEGADNLYVFHEGENRFIARLAPEDQGDWSITPQQLSARVTPDGRHLAFLSIEAQGLAGYDNTRAEGEHCQYELTIESNARFVGSPLCAQAFVYGAEDGEITCASCNPSGARPTGPTILPGWTNPYEGPRYLSDDGSRFFFQSFDSLLPADVDGEKSDVYEFEAAGEGTCDAANHNFDPASGGCRFLVSGGRSSDESYLVDAAADGRDVFFSTRQKLVGWDVNDNYDVYDYRAGGGFAEPVESNPCPSVEACRPPSSPSPPAPSPSTSTFTGPGNPKPTKKPTHHKKRHHKKHKKHGKKTHRKGSSKHRRGDR